MSTYQAEQLRLFLEALDRHQRRRARLVIVGGSAALLQHGATRATRDIDAFEGDPRALAEAARLAEEEIGFRVPIESAAIADLPLHYDDRAERLLPNLKSLELWVPERHDLAGC